MALDRVYELATDGEFGLLAGFGGPPRAGTVTGVLGSGELTVALDDRDGGDVRAWPLNGFSYGTGSVVYVLLAADNAESGIVVGAKAPAPGLGNVTVGRLTAVESPARMVFRGVGGIDSTTPRQLATGVTLGVHGVVIVSDGSAVNYVVLAIGLSGISDVVVGTLTLRFQVTGGGVFQVFRNAGTGSGQVGVMAVML